MRKKFLIWICMFLVLCSFAYAVKPTQVTESPSLQIVYPKFDYFTYGNNITLHFHVHNSTGFLLDDNSSVCLIHLYDKNDLHILKDNLTFENPDYEIDLNTSVLNEEGAYTYIVSCETSIEAGFVSDSFIVSKYPITNEIYEGRILPSLIALGILSFFFLTIGLVLDNEHFFVKLLSFLMSLLYISLIGSSLIMPSFATLIKSIIFSVGGATFLIISYIGYYLIYYYYKKKKKEKYEWAKTLLEFG